MSFLQKNCATFATQKNFWDYFVYLLFFALWFYAWTKTGCDKNIGIAERVFGFFCWHIRVWQRDIFAWWSFPFHLLFSFWLFADIFKNRYSNCINFVEKAGYPRLLVQVCSKIQNLLLAVFATLCWLCALFGFCLMLFLNMVFFPVFRFGCFWLFCVCFCHKISPFGLVALLLLCKTLKIFIRKIWSWLRFANKYVIIFVW